MKIPGLNAPIPFGANFGYHPGGWGQPPLDQFGNPRWGNWQPDSDRQNATSDEFKYWGELEAAEDARSESESDDVLDEDVPVQMVVEQPVRRPTPPVVPLVEKPVAVVDSAESFQELFQVIPERKVVNNTSSILPPTKGYALSADDVRKKLESHAQAAAETAAKAHVVEVEKKPKQTKFKF